MANSPNYSWAEPDNSSLVKNGAQDIRALGDAIDTSVWNIGFGQAGKNKIINGDFGIWQRGTSFTNPNAVYLADRWTCSVAIAVPTWTISQQTFTPGTAPVAGYESQYFLRANVTAVGSSTGQTLRQKIEDVRTFAGQTISLSFWAKADSTRTVANATFTQDFGSGGSGAVVTAIGATSSITTAWQRFTFSVAIPSVTGKTIGTSSSLNLDIPMPAGVNYTLDIWGVQLEYGSKATPFETATGTIQGELAACQRYYFRSTQTQAGATYTSFGFSATTTRLDVPVQFPVTMRVTPTSFDFTALRARRTDGTAFSITNVAISVGGNATNSLVNFTTDPMTVGNIAYVEASSTTSYLGYSAEL
jgi:hypothetical protein